MREALEKYLAAGAHGPIRRRRQRHAASHRRHHQPITESTRKVRPRNNLGSTMVDERTHGRSPRMSCTRQVTAHMIDTTNVVWYSAISVQFLFCLYLVWTQLAQTYPMFTACLGCACSSLAALYFMRGAAGASCPLPIPTSGFGPSHSGCCFRSQLHWKSIRKFGRTMHRPANTRAAGFRAFDSS